jgi:general secretion pathway protein A
MHLPENALNIRCQINCVTIEIEMKKWFVLMLLLSSLFIGQVRAEVGLESIAMTMADYLTAGRIVIAKNQPLINNPAIGNKKFTPRVYEKQVRIAFMTQSGLEIKNLTPSDDFNKALIAIHQSAKDVIAEAQPQINEPGKGFKGFIPAVFGRRVGDKLYKKTGIIIKQTSLKYRSDYNKPDEFEFVVLKKFETAKMGSTYDEQTTFGDTKVLRYMSPLYIEKPCLPCHGEPAGEKDITGKIKEGYKEWDLRGAISVIVPIKCVLGN